MGEEAPLVEIPLAAVGPTSPIPQSQPSKIAAADIAEAPPTNGHRPSELAASPKQEMTQKERSPAAANGDRIPELAATAVAGAPEENGGVLRPPPQLPLPEAPPGLAPAGDDGDVKNRRPQNAVLRPPSHLPQPEAPRGLLTRASSTSEAVSADHNDVHRLVDRSASTNSSSSAAISRFLRGRRDVLSSAISRRLYSFKDSSPPTSPNSNGGVQEIHLPNVKVIVRLKDTDTDNTDSDDSGDIASTKLSLHGGIKGRVSFFSRSGCRDCTAVRSFFRDIALPYVEINLDVFPEREADLIARTGAAHVPQIFLNEKLLGGLVVLNSLRNSGEFERRVRELVGRRCPDTAPTVPLYGFDEAGKEEEEKDDGMVRIARVLRHRLPIQDRFVRVKLVKNCFTGSEMVDGIVNHLDCSRKKAVEIGRELARKHFIHHVFRESDFEDGNQNLYRFLEHDASIRKYFNFRGSTNDSEPKPAAAVGQKLTKIMIAILEAFASDDRRHLDYNRIAKSEEFRRYANLVQDLQRVDIFTLPAEERLSFFLNLYNAMVIHAIIRIGQPGLIDRRSFFTDFQYIVGGYPYSLTTIKNGILRSNRRQPYSLIRPFSSGDKRLELALQKVNPLVHFGLCNGTQSSPTVRFFSPQGVEAELRHAAREFFLSGGIEVDLENRTVHLTRIIKWYSADFGQDRDVLRWVLNYLDATKAGLLTHLLNDSGPISIAYQNFDWSLNT